jgi:hypothetical protein
MVRIEEDAMDFRIGAPPPVGKPPEKTPLAGGAVEAKLLTVRPGRRSRTEPSLPFPDRREESPKADPPGGRILVLLVPDGSQLPPDLAPGSWRVFLRFAKR